MNIKLCINLIVSNLLEFVSYSGSMQPIYCFFIKISNFEFTAEEESLLKLKDAYYLWNHSRS